MVRFLSVIWLLIQGSLLVGQAPDWTINPAAYQYNMSVTARIVVDLEVNNETDNLIAAFVNDEIRGVSQASSVNGQTVFFLTIYSNITQGEEITFEVYLQEEDQVFTALEVLPFENNEVIGQLSDPYNINVSLIGDFPISLLPIQDDTTLTSIPFTDIEVMPLLESMDGDSVIWSTISGSHIEASIVNNELLRIESVDSNWTGTDSIYLIAKETGNTQEFSDTVIGRFTILSDYEGPDFLEIPIQFASNDWSFPMDDLNSFLAYEGNCLDYQRVMIPLSGNEPNPNWVNPPPSGNPMTIIAQIKYDGQGFNDDGILAGFVNGQLAGIANPVFQNGHAFYFLYLFNVASGSIEFRFYDADRMYEYSIASDLLFASGNTQGTLQNPKLIDLSPVHIDLLQDGTLSATMVDTNFTEVQEVQYIVTDCDFPSKIDTATVFYTKAQCSEEPVTLCYGASICVRAPSHLTEVVWFRNEIAISNDSILSIQEPGQYYFEGMDEMGVFWIGCTLNVVAGTSCSHPFPGIVYPVINDVVDASGPIQIFYYLTEIINFENIWTGGGDEISWSDASNWSENAIPCPCQHVIIPEDDTAILQENVSSSVWRVTTLSNAHLTIKSNAELKVIGNF